MSLNIGGFIDRFTHADGGKFDNFKDEVKDKVTDVVDDVIPIEIPVEIFEELAVHMVAIPTIFDSHEKMQELFDDD